MRLRLLGHPIHPMLSDFPLAFWMGSLAWDFMALLRGEPHWWSLSFWCLVLGFVALIPTATAGLIDFAAIPAESRASRTGLWHMAAMLSAASFFGASLFVRGGSQPPEHVALAVGLSCAGAALISIGGWLGGELVFHHGVGVERTDRAS